MFIGKVSRVLFALKPNREFYDVEAAQIDPAVIKNIQTKMENWAEVQAYLRAVYDTLRPSSGNTIENIEVPACLLEAATKRKSTSTSSKRKSSSSTKKKATSSGSQSSEDTNA